MKTFETIISRTIDKDRLAALIELPVRYLRENIRTIVPNQKMTNEGPVLTALFLFTSNYLCEVAVTDDEKISFDAVNFRKIENIRVNCSIATVDLGPETVARYKTAEVNVMHTGSLYSTIEFVGEERDEWLNEILEIFPVTLLSAS